MNENSTPEPQVIQSAQNPYRKYLLVVFGIGIILIVVILLRFRIFDNLISQKKPTPSPSPTPKLTLSCPVPKQYCKLGKQTNYSGHPALLYQLPQGTQVTSAAPVTDSLKVTTTNKSKRISYSLKQTFIMNEQCYTLSYTFPPDSQLAKFDLLPLDVGTNIATTGASLLTVENEQANLIVQLRKRPLDPNTAGQPDFRRCSITNIEPNKIGGFQPIDLSLFK